MYICGDKGFLDDDFAKSISRDEFIWCFGKILGSEAGDYFDKNIAGKNDSTGNGNQENEISEEGAGINTIVVGSKKGARKTN